MEAEATEASRINYDPIDVCLIIRVFVRMTFIQKKNKT